MCVLGGGNSAHVTAGWLASQRGVTVNVYTRRPEAWGKSIKVTTATSSWAHKPARIGHLNVVSNDPAAVSKGTNIFICCGPANIHPIVMSQVAPYVEKNAWMGTLFAQGGFDWAVKHSMGKYFSQVAVVFGMQNIPWICKMTTYGSEARILGPKQHLYVATYPTNAFNAVGDMLLRLFDIPCKPIPNFLTLTLSPSNQIIHPARYYGIFHDWDGKKSYTREELKARDGLTLYEDMDELSAEWLAVLDNELQQIKLALLQRYPELDLSLVLPIGQRVVKQYGPDVKDRSSLRQIFRSNLGYVGCGTPLKEVAGGRVIPNVNTRLFFEDIPYGLCILKNLAELCGNFPTPGIDFMIEWHQQYMGITYLKNRQLTTCPKVISGTGTPKKYGLTTLAEVVSTSLPSAVRSAL